MDLVTNPSRDAHQRQVRDINRTNNISGQRNIANNSIRRKQYQSSIYKKDIKRPQINSGSAQNRRVKQNTLHTAAAYAPVNKNMSGSVSNGTYRQNVKNIGNVSGSNNYSGKNSPAAAFNRNVRNINNTSAAPGRTGTRVNRSAYGRAASIYSKTYVINEERLNGQYTSDKITNAAIRRKHYLNGVDVTTRIRKVKEKIADGRLYAADVLKQLFLFKSMDQSKVVTKEKKKKAIPLKILFIISICVIFIMTWVFSGMKLHENALTIADSEAEILKLQKKIKTDEMLLEDKNDLSYIENVAVNELGMIKKELLPTQYISIGRSDEVELTNAQNTDYVKVTIDALKDIFGHLK